MSAPLEVPLADGVIDEVLGRLKSGKEADISADGATVRTLVIPTNEELIIARDTVRLVEGAEDS